MNVSVYVSVLYDAYLYDA